MKYHYLTKKNIAAYEKWLCQEEYSSATREKYLRGIRRFYRWVQKRAINKEIIMEWKNNLIEQKYAPSTINTMLAALNHLFRFTGWMECCGRYLKVQRRVFRDSHRELTKSEYARLVSSANNGGKEKIALLMETICSMGIRVSEVKYITMETLQAGRTEVHLKGKIRTILIPIKLCRKLLNYAKRQKITSGAVFCTGSGRSMSRYQIWAAMKKLCKTAGVNPQKVYPHNLRHLFAVAYYKAYKDISKLADILGHSNIETTRIYLLTSGTEHRHQLERLGLIS